MPETALWLRLDSPLATIDTCGGKGASLATMARAGLPVPPGFHLTTDAYRAFTADADVASLVSTVDLDDPDAVARTARRAAALLEAREVPEAVAEAVEQGYASLNGALVAVRSSATAEDLPGASFAGQMDSFLNLRGAQAVLEAVKRCWISLWTPRAIDYRARNGIDSGEVSMAVVVQKLVDADAAGVMFTAHPVTGARDQIVINAAWGLGEAVVGGAVSADTVTLSAADASVLDRVTADKAVKTVRTPQGTGEVAVDDDQRGLPVLDDEAAARLAALGASVVALYGEAMDIEWALASDRFSLLQARPVTTLATPREVWNDSVGVDFAWTATNVAEAMPSVMTPATWSMTERSLPAAMAIPGVGEHRVCGNIGGRLYINYSVVMDVARAVGAGRAMEQAGDLAFGTPPAALTVPGVPMSRWKTLWLALGEARRHAASVKHYQRHLDDYVARFPGRCAATRAAIAAAPTVDELATVYTGHCEPLMTDAPRMLAAGGRVNGLVLSKLRPWLRRYVDDADVNTITTGVHRDGESLASLGPLLGLHQVDAGELDADAYIERWGHRGPDELELYAPRPAEEAHWLSRRLAGLADAPDVDTLLTKREHARTEALRRFGDRHPSRVRTLHRLLDAAAEAVRAREATRSESVRVNWVMREFLLRLGELTGHGDDVFFLDFDEIESLLRGDGEALAAVPARRAAYQHYRSLPAFPTWIRGRFDPERWAADPHRRTDYFDADATPAPIGDAIVGTPGSAGIVEGTARVVTDVDRAHELKPGDVLVTKVTNIGWTPVFPRLGAIVTDIGATLSHASIVARELGIPAVVGCHDATVRIADGDRVRVDGDSGTVEIVTGD